MTIAGPVIIGCGIIVILLSVEVCIKRNKVGPPDDDEDLEGIVPATLAQYAYGNFEAEAVTTETKAEDKPSSGGNKRIMLTRKNGKVNPGVEESDMELRQLSGMI